MKANSSGLHESELSKHQRHEARHISLLAAILSLNNNKIHENDCDVKLAKYIYDKAKEIVR